MTTRLLLPMLLFLAGCSTSTTERLNLPELPVVQHVEVERYLGTWYEIASFPQSFQEGCTGTTATYNLRDDGELDVINRCNKNGLDGKEDVAEGRARIVDSKTNAKLEVSFFRPFWGDYWIIDLADDYSYAVVGHPGRDYLWILSRTPQIEKEIYDGIIERLKINGYETTRLNKTLQATVEEPPKNAQEQVKMPPLNTSPPTSYLAADTLAAQLALRIVAVDLSSGPRPILEALELPTPVEFPWSVDSGVFNVPIDTPDGPLNLALILQKGSWEQPKGNGAARSGGQIVAGIELTGPNGLTLPLPSVAKTAIFDDGTPRQFQVWENGNYFEQGTSEKGWTLAKYQGRAPFHTTEVDRRAMEDAMILVTTKILGGEKDLQSLAAKEFSDRKIGENLYDFGAGTLTFIEPTILTARWNGPTQIPRFFNKLNVRMIETSFAHDAGQMVNAIELKEFTIRPTEYFFTDPDAREDEMGLAAEAKFLGLVIQTPNP